MSDEKKSFERLKQPETDIEKLRRDIQKRQEQGDHDTRLRNQGGDWPDPPPLEDEDDEG